MKPTLAELRQAVARIVARASRLPPQRCHALDRRVVAAVVAEVIGEVCGLPPEHVRETQELGDHLGLDILDRIRVEMGLQQGLKLAGALGCHGWTTVGDVVRDVISQAPTRG